MLKLEYDYGNNTLNNGSLREQRITVPGIEDPFIQTYTYDDLNRLASATETNDSAQTWKQTFTIDRYGNRKFNTSGSNTTTLGSCPAAGCTSFEGVEIAGSPAARLQRASLEGHHDPTLRIGLISGVPLARMREMADPKFQISNSRFQIGRT